MRLTEKANGLWAKKETNVDGHKRQDVNRAWLRFGTTLFRDQQATNDRQ